MNVKQAYNIWADKYDTDINLTRDLEAAVLRETMSQIQFKTCLEIGCGTGKNTEWLITRADHVTAVDFSDEMISKAKKKINSDKVNFQLADITQDWTFVKRQYDLVTFSLVLEHAEDLEMIFNQLSGAVSPGGHIYIGELHPFKQYQGSKARFETEKGLHTLTCFNHHISDFIIPAKRNGFVLTEINEYFDDDDRTNVPRILSILFSKPSFYLNAELNIKLSC